MSNFRKSGQKATPHDSRDMPYNLKPGDCGDVPLNSLKDKWEYLRRDPIALRTMSSKNLLIRLLEALEEIHRLKMLLPK